MNQHSHSFDEAPLAPNRSDIARHLYALAAPDFVQPHPDSWIEIAYGDPAVEEGKTNKAKNFSPFKLDQAIAFAEEKNRAGFNIYVGAALRHGERPFSGRASGHHILAASHAWTEYDNAGDDERIGAILKGKGLVPAIVVNTGTVPCPRRHLYFKLDRSATPDEIRAANASLKELLGTDVVQNPDRILRLAGTVSYPPPRKRDERGYVAELVALHQNRDAPAYSLDELIGVAPGGQGGHGYGETEEKPASTVESFFKDVNALALTRQSHRVKPLFGNLVKFHPSTGCWRTVPEANKFLHGRAHLEEAISISQRGVWDYGFEKPSDPISLVVDYKPAEGLGFKPGPRDAALWLCGRMDISPEALGWGNRERRSADDPEYANGYSEGGGEQRAESANNEQSNSQAPSIKLTFFADIGETARKQWILKGVIAKGETSSWIGPPGTGKSALLTDIAIHVASATDWRKYRSKERCGVVYFALERADLVKRRLQAHARRDNIAGIPIAIAGQVIDLMSPACVAAIVSAIRAAEAKFGLGVGMIIIDTFAKGIAANGGDEDKAKDQNITLANLRRVQEQTGVHVAIIGHTGKDEKRGARGSNAHVGDTDLMVQLKGKDIKTAEIIKANDQQEGELTRFKLETFELERDEDGDPITTAILAAGTPDDGAAKGKDKDRAPLTTSERRALEMLERAVLDAGQPPPSSGQFPRNIKVVPLALWRDYCIKGGLTAGDSDGAFRKAFIRVHTGLVDKRRVGIWDNLAWLIH